MSIEEILNDIKANTGIRREKPKVDIDHTAALELFYGIADAMLDWRGLRYDRANMEPIAKWLIAWTYNFGKLDCTKGILLKGGPGKGKTFAMQVYAALVKRMGLTYVSNGRQLEMKLEIVNARTIAQEYANKENGGSAVIERYSRVPFLCIDDIGAESKEQNSFGNKVNVVNDIIDKRLEKNLITFGTTNLNEFDDEAGYDGRMRRRIDALFNQIGVNHNMKY